MIKTWSNERVNDYDLNLNFKRAYYQSECGSQMNISGISCGSPATLIRAPNVNCNSILIRNAGSTTVYIGSAGVGYGGYPLPPLNNIYLNETGSIFGCTPSGVSDIRYMEVQ